MTAMGRDLPVAEHLLSVDTNVSDGGIADVEGLSHCWLLCAFGGRSLDHRHRSEADIRTQVVIGGMGAIRSFAQQRQRVIRRHRRLEQGPPAARSAEALSRFSD